MKTIDERINSAKTMIEAERIAEEICYELSYDSRKSSMRSRYNYLRFKDFETLGWTVICVGCKSKSFAGWLKNNGFRPFKCEQVFYKKDIKEMFMIDEYGGGQLVDIDTKSITELISLDEYKTLLIDKLYELNKKRIELHAYIDGLIAAHKAYLEEEAQQMLRERIINKAIEKAQKEGLIN